MIPKKIVLIGETARVKILSGAQLLADSAVHTLGPFGTNGLIEKGLRITNDGISIASEVQSSDEIEDLALRKVREAASKANDQSGDGSTTTIHLTNEILKESSKKLGQGTIVGSTTTAGLIRQIQAEKEEVIEKLQKLATPIESKEELVRSAIVSVEDEELGQLIGETQWELGPDGVILAEQTAENRTYIERIPGIKIDNGLGLPVRINNIEKQTLELEDVPVILTTNTLTSLEPLLDVLNNLAKQEQREVIVVCRAINDNVIKQIAANHDKGFDIYPINAPYVDQREIMLDLQAILGGRFVDSEDGGVDTIQYSDLGHVSRLVAKRYDGVFTGKENEATQARVAKRVEELEQKLAGSVSDFEKRNLQARIAQLKNGFAVAKVGSVSETERKRVFDKVEDAVNAVRAAYQEGTVPGAGLAFKEIAESLPDTYLLKKPLMSVHAQIMKNAPKDFVIEDWVRDPLKVMRIALEQACSVAGDLATVSVAVAQKRKVDNKEDEE